MTITTMTISISQYKNKKPILAETEIGHFNKKGGLLSLNEAHYLICNKNHNDTYSNEPVTDVKFVTVRCIGPLRK